MTVASGSDAGVCRVSVAVSPPEGAGDFGETDEAKVGSGVLTEAALGGVEGAGVADVRAGVAGIGAIRPQRGQRTDWPGATLFT